MTRRIIEYHLLPTGDIDGILQLMTLCVENNRQWEDYNYQACADWCTESENMEAAVQVLEAGVKEYPQALVCCVVCVWMSGVCVLVERPMSVHDSFCRM